MVAFGFCEYAIPESTLRAIRLLDGLKLGEKALVVSCTLQFVTFTVHSCVISGQS